LDERQNGPQLDEPARRRLVAALDRPGVIVARLFGSQARGQAGPLSDVDIAVWLTPDVADRHAFQLELIAAASEALATNAVEVVVLNDASPLLRHRALRDGELLVERDPVSRVRLDAATIVEYLDTTQLRETLARGIRHRLEEGRFGRP
jgi:predicted nucleotidyltransferase